MISCAFLGAFGEFLASSQVQILYWALALAGTFLFGLLMVLTMLGFGGLHDTDVGPDGAVTEHPDTGYSDFKLISIRSVMAFVTFFGWGGVIWGRFGWAGFGAAVLCGFSMMLISAGLICLIFRLQHSGNIAAEDYVGQRGTVYIGIPGGRNAPGKATVAIAGATVEITAVADAPIATGTTVKIVEKLDERKFLVEQA